MNGNTTIMKWVHPSIRATF